MSTEYAEIEARITEACCKVAETEKPNIAHIEWEFEVPESRLWARWNGRQTRGSRPAVNKRLTEAEELAVCMYLKRLDTIGTSVRLPMVKNCANDILKRNHPSGTSDPPPTVSEVWSKRFLARHPEFHIRKQKAIEDEWKNAHDPGVILDWFARYQQECEESGVLVGNRYNFDETGFRIGIGRNQWIVTMDPDRQAHLGSTTNRELVTACEAIS